MSVAAPHSRPVETVMVVWKCAAEPAEAEAR
jgi:hypothetical protein